MKPPPTISPSYISLTSPGILPPQQMLPSILQMYSNYMTLQAQCNAAIVGIFKWRKVTAIYENIKDFSADSGLVTLLSDSLRIVNSEVKHHLAFLPLTSLSKPEAAIEEELKKLMTKSNRVLVLLHCSLELAILIFDKAKQMGMIEKGYVWIVSKEIASLLHSLDSSIFDNMQERWHFGHRCLDSVRPSFGTNRSVRELSPVYWPGGLQKGPKGCSSRSEEQPLKIGVPAKGAFNQFVRVSYDLGSNGTYFSGFSV
ncbi:hypothetical protein Q3G72_020856 [Acer saccharum]|nr:hypothetical protein Q3G72_020856 [Acer saccharum]